MKKIVYAIYLFSITLLVFSFLLTGRSQAVNETSNVLEVYFSPKGGCMDQVIYWINKANYSIHILIYSFTLEPVADALVNASRRGVDVKVVFEKSQINKYSMYWKLLEAGIPVANDTNSKSMHDKVMVVDDIIVLTGSYNWSNNAEKYNNENLVVIKGKWVADKYEAEFEKIWNQSIVVPEFTVNSALTVLFALTVLGVVLSKLKR